VTSVLQTNPERRSTAQYQFDFGLRPSVAWVSKGKDLNSAFREWHKIWLNTSTWATYSFNKNMSTYVDYKINLLDEDETSTAQTASHR
jgi:predicted porin